MSGPALGMCKTLVLGVPQVEKWLMSVLQVMRATVRARMTDAVAAYEDRPRDQWVGDYPAQVPGKPFSSEELLD